MLQAALDEDILCLFLTCEKQRKKGGLKPLFHSFVLHALERDTQFFNPILVTSSDNTPEFSDQLFSMGFLIELVIPQPFKAGFTLVLLLSYFRTPVAPSKCGILLTFVATQGISECCFCSRHPAYVNSS